MTARLGLNATIKLIASALCVAGSVALIFFGRFEVFMPGPDADQYLSVIVQRVGESEVLSLAIILAYATSIWASAFFGLGMLMRTLANVRLGRVAFFFVLGLFLYVAWAVVMTKIGHQP